MTRRTAYCSANDRSVPVLLAPAAEDVHFSPHDAVRVVCLDYGVRCTGAMCPLFSFPGEASTPGVGRIRGVRRASAPSGAAGSRRASAPAPPAAGRPAPPADAEDAAAG